MQLVPWIPFALEAISGQKVPAMGGTIGEIQSSLSQIQFSLTQLLSNQQRMLRYIILYLYISYYANISCIAKGKICKTIFCQFF
jgi:hypothetical protein